MIIKTKNLVLRPFDNEYINSRYISWMNDLDIIKYLGREEYFKGFTYEDAFSYFEKMTNDHKVKFYSIIYEDKVFIGTCKTILIESNPKNMISEIGIMIGDKNYWGKGLAKETITGLSKSLFSENNKKIIAGGFAVNKSMVHAFKSAGFKEEGILRKRILSNKKLYDQIILGCFKDELN